MTTTQQTPAPVVEITQADRDAAADLAAQFQRYTYVQIEAPAIRRGEHDNWEIVISFARHRLRFTPPTDTMERKEAGVGDFQARVQPWLLACFGEMIAGDREERNHRFLEEALELVQACGCGFSEAHQLVDYVYGRDIGEPAQEVGGVMVTLAALCLANGLDMHANGETELARIWTKVEAIRAKQAAKPKHSPLPQHVAPPSAVTQAVGVEAETYREMHQIATEVLGYSSILEALEELHELKSATPVASVPEGMHHKHIATDPASETIVAHARGDIAYVEGLAISINEGLPASDKNISDLIAMVRWNASVMIAAAEAPKSGEGLA